MGIRKRGTVLIRGRGSSAGVRSILNSRNGIPWLRKLVSVSMPSLVTGRRKRLFRTELLRLRKDGARMVQAVAVGYAKPTVRRVFSVTASKSSLPAVLRAGGICHPPLFFILDKINRGAIISLRTWSLNHQVHGFNQPALRRRKNMKTITLVAAMLALSAGTALAEKPALEEDTNQGTVEAKVKCLTGIGLANAASPDEYFRRRNQGEGVFYIDDAGVTTVARKFVAKAKDSCADVLGAQH
jgi:hypothetical protein